MAWQIPDEGTAADDIQSELFQASLTGLAAGFAETGVLSGCAVSQHAGTPNMSVDVAVGRIELAGVVAAVTAGTVTITAADGTNPRLDLIVANASGTLSVLTGTAGANPKEPSLDPTTYVVLAQVLVSAAVTSILTAKITDRRVVRQAPAAVPRNHQTGTSYTAVVGDVGKSIDMDNAAANTLTINSGVFSADDTFEVCQYGAGQTTLVAGSGVTIHRGPSVGLKLYEQYSTATLRAISGTEFVAAGDLTA